MLSSASRRVARARGSLASPKGPGAKEDSGKAERLHQEGEGRHVARRAGGGWVQGEKQRQVEQQVWKVLWERGRRVGWPPG